MNGRRQEESCLNGSVVMVLGLPVTDKLWCA